MSPFVTTGKTNITSVNPIPAIGKTEIEGSGGVYLNSGNVGTPLPIAPNITITDNLD